jgi:elongation factor G
MESMEEIPGGFTIIHARAPLAELMTYARTLSNLTRGQGSFTMDYSSYEFAPPNQQASIIASANGNGGH